jgi:MtfA peptidase
MTGWIVILLLVAAGIAFVVVSRRRRESRRRLLRAKPFPAGWRELLDRNLPLYRQLPETLREELHGRIQVFLAEKNFEGAGGMEITDEVRVTIAAQACLLLLNRETEYYPRLFSIIVYPTAFEVEKPAYFSGPLYIEDVEERLGESWSSGAIVLAWDEARSRAEDVRAGRNLCLHEFAHQLDQENASADGIPILSRSSRYAPWARVLGKEYRRLKRRVSAGMWTLLDEYGATSEAEFFSVATECFFIRPRQMKTQYPELYGQLQEFYRQDPASYPSEEHTVPPELLRRPGENA